MQKKYQLFLNKIANLSPTQKNEVSQLMKDWELAREEVIHCFRIVNSGYKIEVEETSDGKQAVEVYHKEKGVFGVCETRYLNDRLSVFFGINEDMIDCLIDISD